MAWDSEYQIEFVLARPRSPIKPHRARRPQSARDPTVRDRHIAPIGRNGRMACDVLKGYNWPSRIETEIGRWKSVIGPRFQSRRFSWQITEIQVGQKVLNTNDRTRTFCVRTHRLMLPPGKGRIPLPPPDPCNNALFRPYSTNDRAIKRYFTLNFPIAAVPNWATIPTPH